MCERPPVRNPVGSIFSFSCNYIEFDICFKTLFLKISLFMVQHYSSGCIRLCTGTNVLPVPYNIGNIVKKFSCIWVGFFIHFLEGQIFFLKIGIFMVQNCSSGCHRLCSGAKSFVWPI